MDSAGYRDYASQDRERSFELRRPGGEHQEPTGINKRAKRWVLTWNNPPENWRDVLEYLFQRFNGKYIIAEEERGEEGTFHIQGYVRFGQSLYYRTLRSIVPGYWDIARGDEVSNYRYCTKSGVGILEIGERLNVVENWVSKVDKLKKMLEDLGRLNWTDFEDRYPAEAFNQRKKLLEWKFAHTKSGRVWNGNLPEKNLWVYGQPGTGKSRWAHNLLPMEQIYKKNVNKWWDGYEDLSVKIVLIEDFPIDDKKWLINIVKIWADRYPFNGEVKGGTVKVTPGRWLLIVTSNHSIEEVFNECPIDDVNAIRRRFKEIEFVTGGLNQYADLDFSILDD